MENNMSPQPPVSARDVPAAGRRLNKEPNPVGFEPRVLYGQGKRATTILSGEGYTYPIIAHDAKNDGYDRMKMTTAPMGRLRKGVRPMHMTTMVVAKPGWEPDYTTTNMQVK
ncbi:hypothetical protein BaRGS_00014271 [Batillaria attramentaria]|uniref:Uncharacterized protein n=1 Tax=Batillaria attramentaria TaxID=370345 RepID=A0ABD0L5U2_9CAEN